MNWPPTRTGTGGAARAPARRRPRLTALAAMLAAAAVALTACGGGGSPPTTTGSSTFDKALNFTKCMRSHGVPDYPDPFIITPGSPSPKEPHSVVRAALRACRHLMPASGPGSLTPAQNQQMRQRALRFVQCLRAHGLPDIPDPGANGSISLPNGMDNSPRFTAAQRSCRSLQLPPGGGQ
jgi:hypothetical protein